MAHSPLADFVARALRSARRGPAGSRGGGAAGPSRRTLLKAAAAGGLAAWLDPTRLLAKATDPAIAIVGGGLAGLNCAWQLAKKGIRTTLYEASGRPGGRTSSVTGAIAPGVVSELGATFISADHVAMLELVQEFGLELIDWQTYGEGRVVRKTVFAGGRMRTAEEAAAALVPFAKKAWADAGVLKLQGEYRVSPEVARLDRQSLEEYLAGIEMERWARDLLVSNYETEFGLAPGDQSVVNALEMVSHEDSPEPFDPIGASDERFKVKDGNQAVAAAIASRLGEQVRFGWRLAAVRARGEGFRLAFEVAGRGMVDVDCDVAVLAIPFTVLRELEVKVELPPEKRRVIRELGYGNCSKIVIGMDTKPWVEAGYAGYVYTDESFQCGWDDSGGLHVGPGGFSMFLGGGNADRLPYGKPEDHARKHLVGLERIYPGALAAFNEKVLRAHWPSHRFAKGGYSCYRVGQASTLAGTEMPPVGNLYFCGEHCTPESRAYMNGAAQTGWQVASELATLLRG